jgi:hypothetical protein
MQALGVLQECFGSPAFSGQSKRGTFRAVKRLSKVILIALAVLIGLSAVTIGALLVYLRGDGARQRIQVAVTKR